MKVYTVNDMVGPTKAIVTVSDTDITYDLYEEIDNTQMVTYSATNKFADIAAQDDFADYALYVRCFDKATDEVRILGASVNRLVNILASTMYRPRNNGSAIPANMTYIDDFLVSLYNSVSVFNLRNQPGVLPPELGFTPKPKASCLKNDIHLMMAIIVPFADSKPKDWVLVLPTFDSDTTIKGAKLTGDLPFLRDVRKVESPTLEFAAGPIKDGDIWTFTVNVLNGDGTPAKGHAPELFFETTAGVLLTQRVFVDPKTAQAKCLISVAGLPKDYPIRIKAGFQYFTGLASCKVTKDT